MVFDFTLGFWAVLVVGSIVLTIQETFLYQRLSSLVDKIEDFTDLVISSQSKNKK